MHSCAAPRHLNRKPAGATPCRAGGERNLQLHCGQVVAQTEPWCKLPWQRNPIQYRHTAPKAVASQRGSRSKRARFRFNIQEQTARSLSRLGARGLRLWQRAPPVCQHLVRHRGRKVCWDKQTYFTIILGASSESMRCDVSGTKCLPRSLRLCANPTEALEAVQHAFYSAARNENAGHAARMFGQFPGRRSRVDTACLGRKACRQCRSDERRRAQAAGSAGGRAQRRALVRAWRLLSFVVHGTSPLGGIVPHRLVIAIV